MFGKATQKTEDTEKEIEIEPNNQKNASTPNEQRPSNNDCLLG